jgi:predicted 3-demethylubiquinone-9 3-methyltransferase (glyoxalase superfamily)
MQKIIPHLWFDKEAVQAAEFYTSIFPNSKITNQSVIKDTPSGDSEIVGFDLNGYSFMAISAGPYFKINPSISFFVNFDPAQDKDAEKNIDIIWNKLVDGGTVLMELKEYPFSKRYGWVQDKFGVSWQLILSDPNGELRPYIMPSLLFVNKVVGKAEEAVQFYLSVFKNSHMGMIAKYAAEQKPNLETDVMFSDFQLEGQWFSAMDSRLEHGFEFNEAVSLLVSCKDQAEIDYYWEKLSAVPEAEQCGWLRDKYGVSWQIHPQIMNKMMSEGTPEQIGRVTQAFLKMKKFDIAELEKAYQGKE